MDIATQADILAQKIKHLLITTSSHTIDDASIEDFYYAFCLAIREEVMINWTSTLNTIEGQKKKIAYFLSMEYLPGRFLHSNLVNIGATELIQAVFTKLGRNFSEVIQYETDPSLGNGGLGRLSSCFLESLASLQYPARGYGLRYQYGIFEQEIWNGIQVERPDCWLLNAYPWESRRDSLATTIHLGGVPSSMQNKHGDEVELLSQYEEVRALPYDLPIIGYRGSSDYSVLSLRLWSTKESPRNFQLQRYNAGFLDEAAENTTLTDVLYPNDNTELGKRVRLKQEFLLVSASLQDILRRHLRIFGDLTRLAEKVRIQINDTHPALIIVELMRTLTKNYDFSWEMAWETTQACCSYTNHTILKEALEEWNEERFIHLLPRQYRIIQKLNWDFCQTIRSHFPGDEERVRRMSLIEKGQIRMANLAIFGSHKVNGVAELHTEILKTGLFHDFATLYPEKFLNVTNGVTHRRWLLHANPRLSAFITERIGTDWISDFSQIEKLRPFAKDKSSQEEFLRIKKECKKDLISFLQKENGIRDASGKILKASCCLDENALFDMHIKRIHEYKRQLMNALHLIMVYQEIQKNPTQRTVPRLSIFGGKAAPGYTRAKQIIQLISALSRAFRNNPLTEGKLRVIFVENYNVSKAEVLIPAADLSEQISTAGWEASGTGNMKLAMNGALTIGTEDGANIEMRKAMDPAWWPFAFGASAEEIKAPYNPEEISSQDEKIQNVLKALEEGHFAETEEEKKTFRELYEHLRYEDTFRVLKDLPSYATTQAKVETLFSTPLAWAEMALQNISAMGPFSTDRSIREYATKIWGIEPAPLDPQILQEVRSQYSAHDRCRIEIQN